MILRRAAFLALPLALAAAAPRIAHSQTPLTTIRVAQGLSRPLFVTSPPGDTSRLFFVEQRGPDNRARIKILKNGTLLATPFLTVGPVATGEEQGLLGLAFAPDYATSGRLYVAYSDSAEATMMIERHVVSADPDVADPTGVVILSIPHPLRGHNGGWLGFGPDGYLYISIGDDGSVLNSQNLGNLLGKILRLDVSGAGYTIPPGNPFGGEIWSYGLRNAWRPSFDRATGDMVIADVGEGQREEIDFAPLGSGAGANYGWPCFEGSLVYDSTTVTPCGSCSNPACPKVFPSYEYDHTLGRCAITGGYVYRGSGIPDLRGQYFFGDYCSGHIYTGEFQGGALVNVTDRTVELAPVGGYTIDNITSFGEDAQGELYICDGDGEVFAIVPKSVTAVELSLVSTEVTEGHVRLEWHTTEPILSATLYRTQSGVEWNLLGSPGSVPGGLAFDDASVTAGGRYGYRLVIRSAQGEESTLETWVSVPGEAVPKALRFDNARPNPSSGPVTFQYGTPRPGRVRLSVYDVRGRLVAALFDQDVAAGWRSAVWSGRDRRGREVPSGIYFASLEQGGVVEIRKVIVAR